MFKHIVGQVLLQITVLGIILFYGPYFIPEYRDKFDNIIGANLSAKYHNGIP